MFDFIYVESAVRTHPRSLDILARYPRATVVPCERFGEIFNRRGQDFRLQKRRPALILAEKHGKLLLETPRNYGIGGERNFYFSHSLNCVYDCRYCFLQGMYRSAHIVLFVNYEDFQGAIDERIRTEAPATPYFFSGYDCDSLALEPLSGFAASFLPFFEERPDAVLELRTKSVQIRGLLARDALPNCVVAFSLAPEAMGRVLELGVPSLRRRLEAARSLQEHGWPLGLRFDPLLYLDDFRDQYRAFFAEVFSRVDVDALHSVSLGPFRLPREVFRRMRSLRPRERFLAFGLQERDGGLVTYRDSIAADLDDFCTTEILGHVPERILFRCGERSGRPREAVEGTRDGA